MRDEVGSCAGGPTTKKRGKNNSNSKQFSKFEKENKVLALYLLAFSVKIHVEDFYSKYMLKTF